MRAQPEYPSIGYGYTIELKTVRVYDTALVVFPGKNLDVTSQHLPQLRLDLK